MNAKKIMGNPVSCSPYEPIFHVYNLMHKRKTDHIVVVNKNSQPIGVISYRDITFFRIAMVVGLLGVVCTSIKDLMAKPWCVYEDSNIETIIDLVTSKSINSAPVVDREIKLKGIILAEHLLKVLRDFLKSNCLSSNNLAKIKAKDIMVPEPIFCKPDDTAIEVDKVMAKHHIGHMPVLSDSESMKILGVVSFKDLNSTIMSFDKAADKKIKKIRSKITNFMGKNLWVVDENETLDKIIDLMVEKNIGSVPVVDNMENKKLLGIICRRDIYVTLQKFEI